LQDYVEACFSFLCCPLTHHKRIRTTPILIERAFKEQKLHQDHPAFLVREKLSLAGVCQADEDQLVLAEHAHE
jgi:hypothetical protein